MYVVKGIICCNHQKNPLKDIIVEEKHDYVFDNDIQVNSVQEILDYVALNMTYKDEKNDYWQLPEQSYNWKTGDCEDYCIFMMYLLKEKLGIDSELILVKPRSNVIHTIVYYNNSYSDPTYYDPEKKFTNISVPKSHILWRMPYAEAIWMTYHYHDNVGKYIR